MVSVYCGICVDPGGDNYTVGSELMAGVRLDRKVNAPSSFQFKVSNKDNAVGSTFTVDDKVDFHVGVEPLFMWGSLSALSFATDDDVSVSHDASLDFGAATDFTVCFRFKIPAFGSGTYELISKSDGGSPDWRTYMGADGSLSLEIDDGVADATITSASGYDDDVWHTAIVAADRDGNGQWYVDGSASGNAVDISGVGDIDDGQPLYIGSLNNTDNFLTGKLDETCVYSEVISTADRTAYESGSPDTTNLEAYWDFDEGYGTSATDESTNTNTGTISGASWVNPKIMTGTIMDIDLERMDVNRNELIIQGEDYLTVLGERLGRATFPGVNDVSTILINLLTEFASGEYTTVNVNATGTTVTNFTSGAETTLLALMRRLADLPGSSQDFYLDGGNDLVWHPRANASWSSGVTLNEDNIRRMVVKRSTRDKKTFIKVTGAQTPVEEAVNRQSTVTDSVTLDTNYYADDFIAQHNNLMAIDLYLQKVGTPGEDLTGRIAIAKYDMPSGDFLQFTLREDDISTDAGWYRITTPMNTQVSSRYFIRLDTAGSNSSNTYKWYGDTPAVLDTERKAKQSTDGIYWTAADYDFAMKVYYGEYAELTSLDAATPRRDGVVALPNNSGIDDVQGQDLADHILANYLQTAWKATVRFDCPSTELKPSYLITLDEADDGLDSKTYRIETIRMEFGATRKCDYYDIDISATLPYTYLGEEDSKLRESLLSGNTGTLESGTSGEITTAKCGFAKIGRSYCGVYPDES